jgi:glycosyltransferase involved in cell wall biosynthesis
MDKKKIILVGTAYPYRGGIAVFNERLARCFQEEGYEVVIWTFTVQYPNFLFPGKTQFSTESAPEGLTIYRKLNSVNPFNWLKVGRQLRKAEADLVVMRYWIPYMAPSHGFIARRARKNKKTRVVSVFDNILPHEKGFADRMLARYFMRSLNGGVTMSKSVSEEAKAIDPHVKLQFCEHPLYDIFGAKVSREEALDFLHLDPQYRYMLFFGIIRDYKGLDLLLKAMGDNRLKQRKVKLIIAGEFYNNAEQYHELEQRLDLSQQLVWRSEFVPDSEVKYYFNAADIVVQPYKSATQSGVTQIAYHFEKPMLVTDVGGLKEIVPDKEVGYVTEVDPLKIADALDDFFENQRYDEFVKNVRVEKQKYSWNRMVDALVSVSKD